MSREACEGRTDSPRFTPETLPSELVYEYGTIVGLVGSADSRQEMISQLNCEAAVHGETVINIEEVALAGDRTMITGVSVPNAIQ